MLQIGEVADRVGLSLRTLRHWDDMGLVVPSARSTGGFRLYTDADVARLEFVMSLRPLGLSLDELRRFVEVVDAARGGGVDGVRSEVEQYRTLAADTLRDLRRQVRDLAALAGEFDGLLGPD